MQVIITALSLGEVQSGAPNSAADVKQLFNHFPGLLGRLKTYALHPLLRPFSAPFSLCSLGIAVPPAAVRVEIQLSLNSIRPSVVEL